MRCPSKHRRVRDRQARLILGDSERQPVKFSEASPSYAENPTVFDLWASRMWRAATVAPQHHALLSLVCPTELSPQARTCPQAGPHHGRFPQQPQSRSPQWFDVPGTYHNGGCGFAFADGHSESHHWQSPSPKQGHQAPVSSPQDLKDWAWMRERTSAHNSGTMPPPQ
jgi:prepilin-type processing-associated H-X9-DG protein